MVKMNPWGFYELENKPTPDELADYYANKYYQDCPSKTYAKTYSELELRVIQSRIASRYAALEERVETTGFTRFLDVGCGEGFSLPFFAQKGFDVYGMDFSASGVMQQNPEFVDSVKVGNLFESLATAVEQNLRFDVVWLQNVLEHVLDPVDLMSQLKTLVSDNGVLVLTAPNDFSVTQVHAKQTGDVEHDYWLAIPDHISYFNCETLLAFVRQMGWQVLDQLADFPIDWFLFNSAANYIKKPQHGPAAHKARLEIEELIAQSSLQKVNQFYRALSAVGMGRNTVLILKPIRE